MIGRQEFWGGKGFSIGLKARYEGVQGVRLIEGREARVFRVCNC